MRNERALEPQAKGPLTFELLYELSKSDLGLLSLGRVVGGRDVGRPVVLRALSPAAHRRVEGALSRATGIVHPRLLKTLGVTRIDGRPYLVSEHVDGLPLTELARPMHAAATSLVPEVALRIILDALLAVGAAHDELARCGEKGAPRCLFPDTAWVASFGETLLCEAGVACELAEASKTPASSDVFAAGSLLWELISGQPLTEAAPLERAPGIETVRLLLPNPEPLLGIVSRAVIREAEGRFSSVLEMSEAIQELPVHCIASDAEVRAAVEVMLHVAPDTSTQAPSGTHEVDPWDTPTRSLRARSLLPTSSDATTQRPPLPPRTPTPR
ncbi:MAG: hypothetical protein QM756_37295 [Polyangiaceae bacterium]